MPKAPEPPPPSRGPKRPMKDVDGPEMEPASPFDINRLKQLLEMMELHGMSEISLRSGDEQIRLRRGGAMVAAPVFAPAPMQAAPTPTAAPGPAPAAAKVDDGLLVIKAPTVGTFYSAQTPEDPPFVTVGSKVNPATTVCLIEAMKVFNPIAAELSGTIETILVKNGDAVEYGQALFKVRS